MPLSTLTLAWMALLSGLAAPVPASCARSLSCRVRISYAPPSGRPGVFTARVRVCLPFQFKAVVESLQGESKDPRGSSTSSRTRWGWPGCSPPTGG